MVERGQPTLINALPPGAHVIMEAAGGCEHALWVALLRAGRTTSRVNSGPMRGQRHITAVMRKLLCVLNLLISNPNFKLAN